MELVPLCRTSRIIFSVICSAAVSLAGCKIPDQFADRAVDYNKSVEDAENGQLLLNIVRASLGRPLHITALSQVRGNMSATAQLSGNAGLEFGPNVSNKRALSVSPSFSVANNPSFDVAVLNTREFANGFLTPIDLKTIDLLTNSEPSIRKAMFLFVDEISIELMQELRDKRYRINNRPYSEPGDAVFFGCVVDFLVQAGLAIQGESTPESLGVRLEEQSLGNVSQIIDAYDKGIRYKRAGNKISLARNVESLGYGFDILGYEKNGSSSELGSTSGVKQHLFFATSQSQNRSEQEDVDKKDIGIYVSSDGKIITVETQRGPVLYKKNIARETLCGQLDRVKDGDESVQALAHGLQEELSSFIDELSKAKTIKLNFVQRSTADVLMLLGEVARLNYSINSEGTDKSVKEVLRTFIPGEVGGLMDIIKSNSQIIACGAENFLVCVDYDSNTWAIRDEDLTSASALATISQLLALNKSRSDAPVTSAVTIVGGGSIPAPVTSR